MSIELWKDLSLGLTFKSFQRVSHMLIWDINILFTKLTSLTEVKFENHHLHIMPQGLGISRKACLLFLILLLVVTCTLMLWLYTAQEMKFSIMDFFSKCDQIRRFLLIWSHLLKKSVMKNFIFCAVIELF